MDGQTGKKGPGSREGGREEGIQTRRRGAKDRGGGGGRARHMPRGQMGKGQASKQAREGKVCLTRQAGKGNGGAGV